MLAYLLDCGRFCRCSGEQDMSAVALGKKLSRGAEPPRPPALSLGHAGLGYKDCNRLARLNAGLCQRCAGEGKIRFAEEYLRLKVSCRVAKCFDDAKIVGDLAGGTVEHERLA